MRHFDYIFDELPLVTVGDVEACLIAGEATIEYDNDGIWEVTHVTVDGYRGKQYVATTAPLNIQAMVIERLYGSWRDKVQEAVSEEIETNRIIDEEDHADMKLSERKLGL